MQYIDKYENNMNQDAVKPRESEISDNPDKFSENKLHISANLLSDQTKLI